MGGFQKSRLCWIHGGAETAILPQTSAREPSESVRSRFQQGEKYQTPPALALGFHDIAKLVTQWLAPDSSVQKGLAELLGVF